MEKDKLLKTSAVTAATLIALGTSQVKANADATQSSESQNATEKAPQVTTTKSAAEAKADLNQAQNAYDQASQAAKDASSASQNAIKNVETTKQAIPAANKAAEDATKATETAKVNLDKANKPVASTQAEANKAKEASDKTSQAKANAQTLVDALNIQKADVDQAKQNADNQTANKDAKQDQANQTAAALNQATQTVEAATKDAQSKKVALQNAQNEAKKANELMKTHSNSEEDVDKDIPTIYFSDKQLQAMKEIINKIKKERNNEEGSEINYYITGAEMWDDLGKVFTPSMSENVYKVVEDKKVNGNTKYSVEIATNKAWKDTDEVDKNTVVDVQNMTKDQILELSNFAAAIINQMREKLGLIGVNAALFGETDYATIRKVRTSPALSEVVATIIKVNGDEADYILASEGPDAGFGERNPVYINKKETMASLKELIYTDLLLQLYHYKEYSSLGLTGVYGQRFGGSLNDLFVYHMIDSEKGGTYDNLFEYYKDFTKITHVQSKEEWMQIIRNNLKYIWNEALAQERYTSPEGESLENPRPTTVEDLEKEGMLSPVEIDKLNLDQLIKAYFGGLKDPYWNGKVQVDAKTAQDYEKDFKPTLDEVHIFLDNINPNYVNPYETTSGNRSELAKLKAQQAKAQAALDNAKDENDKAQAILKDAKVKQTTAKDANNAAQQALADAQAKLDAANQNYAQKQDLYNKKLAIIGNRTPQEVVDFEKQAQADLVTKTAADDQAQVNYQAAKAKLDQVQANLQLAKQAYDAAVKDQKAKQQAKVDANAAYQQALVDKEQTAKDVVAKQTALENAKADLDHAQVIYDVAKAAQIANQNQATAEKYYVQNGVVYTGAKQVVANWTVKDGKVFDEYGNEMMVIDKNAKVTAATLGIKINVPNTSKGNAISSKTTTTNVLPQTGETRTSHANLGLVMLVMSATTAMFGLSKKRKH